MTKLLRMRDRSVVRILGNAVGEIVLRRIAREVREGQHHDGQMRRLGRRGGVRGDGRGRGRGCRERRGPARAEKIPGAGRRHEEQGSNPEREQPEQGTSLRFGGLRLGGRADLQRIDPDRLGDVLELGRAEIGDGEIEPPLHLPVGLLGETDRARLGDALEPRRDIDAVAHQITVALFDDVAEMDADAEDDAPVLRHARVALDHRVLHFDCTAHGVDHATELDERPVACTLDDAPVMDCDRRVDQIAAQRAQPGERAVFVRAGQTAESDNVGGEDRGEAAGGGHCSGTPALRMPSRMRSNPAIYVGSSLLAV